MLLQRDFFGWQGWGGISRVGGGHENSSCTLPETNFLPPKIGRANQKEFHLPTIDFVKLLVSGRVTLWTGKKNMFSFPSCICQQVKEVSHFPDIEVQVVESFPDLEVRRRGYDHTLEIWHRYHKLKMVVWKMYLLSHYGYFGVSIFNILKFRGSESRPTFLNVAGYFEVNNPRCSEGKGGLVTYYELGPDLSSTCPFIPKPWTCKWHQVKKVSHFPDRCGEWQMVDHFPDFTVKFVRSFPDVSFLCLEEATFSCCIFFSRWHTARVVQCLSLYMDVSENSDTPKSSTLIGFSIINHPFWGTPHM